MAIISCIAKPDILRYELFMKVFITNIRSCLGTHLSQRFLEAGWQVAGSSWPDQRGSLFDEKNLGSQISLLIHESDEGPILIQGIEYFQPDLVIQLDRQELKNQISTSLIFERNLGSSLQILEGIKRVESVRSFITLSTDHVLSYKKSDQELSEELPPFGEDFFSASLAARENLINSFSKHFFSIAKYKQHRKSFSVVRMPSTQCLECHDDSSPLWSEIQRAVRNQTLPQIENPGAFRQWYPVMEAVEHLYMLGELSVKSPEGAGVWHFASTTVPAMTVGRYLQTLNPDWVLPDSENVRSRHPLLALVRLNKLILDIF